MDASAAVAMLDLDGDTKDLATKGADDFVRQQSYDFEAAFVRQGRLAWALYDTDNDGAYDVVLFTRDVKKGTVDAAYRLDKSGDNVTPLADAGTSIVQPERVTKNPKVQASMREIFGRIVESASEKEKEKEREKAASAAGKEPGRPPSTKSPPAPKK